MDRALEANDSQLERPEFAPLTLKNPETIILITLQYVTKYIPGVDIQELVWIDSAVTAVHTRQFSL